MDVICQRDYSLCLPFDLGFHAMSAPKRPINVHQSYHAHVYFDEQTVQFATDLCHQAGETFGLKVGRVHEKLVGPHMRWSCQILFGHEVFDEFLSWLDAHRGGLSVLVHGDTGDNYEDHTTHAYWLGEEVDINLSHFERNR
ncbi:DOPA 4,5-dioxygenase family protein [Rhodanobacter aciditrophus]|uniref:DOPA 4,5-dioxygenase family protein n=1 Tax=Rhodanobacter aciditrophus TaxID=1623218 RepID=A0ABW4B0Q1_9GAMM